MPKDQKLEAMRIQISELDAEYLRSATSASKLAKELDDKTIKITNLADLLRKSENKVSTLNALITRFCQVRTYIFLRVTTDYYKY